MHDRWLVRVCVGGTSCFVACFGVAIALYPGGTWFDRRAEGHSFWMNFLCDLMQSRALNGEAAPIGSWLARIGTVLILVALMSFFVQIGRLQSPPSRAGRVARSGGLVACGLGFLVPTVPSDLFRDAHVFVVVLAFIPALIATIAAFIVSVRAPEIPWWVRALALLTMVTGGLDGIMYGLAYAQAYGYVPPVQRLLLNQALPVVQRIATLGLLAWVLAICLHTTLRSRGDEAQPR